MRETRVHAADVLEKIAGLASEPAANGGPAEVVHPHKTKAVAAENVRAFSALMGGS